MAAPIPPLEPPLQNHVNRHRLIVKLTAVLLLASLIIGIYYWFFLRMYETTDDAYVGGFAINLSPQIDGIVSNFYVNDTELVKTGELLIELDSTDWKIALDESIAALALAAREVASMVEDVSQRQAALRLEQARLTKARQDFENRVGLVGSEAISKEDFQHTSADLQIAESSVDLAYHQLQTAITNLGTTLPENHPRIEAAKLKVQENYINLDRCRILAPKDGYIAKRSVEVGQWVRRGTPMLSIIPLNTMWVDANFKETQIGQMRIGQDVEITTDIYRSHVVYHGKIAGIVAGTGSVFSLLPPQNATGNWIKIVQRVPVRIYLNPEDLKKHPLVLGLSAYVSVNLSNQSGPFLAQETSDNTFVQTDIYQISLEKMNQLIEKIIKDNLTFAQQTI